MEIKFSRYDTADYLETEDDITAYIEAIRDEGDLALTTAALDDVARARERIKNRRGAASSLR
ncbi:helix-turn-helix domain-containing transcriptional regulator [Pseudogemmobacter bohemicus]|uniref:helix-turn-helix domain-containing transcriptional regulator n=1 Tax=Pseudogemmobacter bohemicus TaxID=2250708 RepID=UPI000DD39639|nr:XRE family transcriptional regulator [Pseudogemmobacter bohemicus]